MNVLTIDKFRDDSRLSDLRAIRRASMAIRSCAEILNEHFANDGSIPAAPRVWIRLEPEQEGGLCYAIEACANRITEIFDAEQAFGDIEFQDEICPKITKEAELQAEMQSGEITYEEYIKKMEGAT